MSKKLLIVGYVWPEPKSSAAGTRMLQLIGIFLKNDYKITFASPCEKTQNAFDLERIGVAQNTIELNHASFDDFVSALQPDVVMFDRFMMEEQFGWRVAQHCPNALRILDTEDLHFLRKGRHQAYKDGVPFNDLYLYNEIAKREIASIYRCDLSLIISEVEMEILKNNFNIPTSLITYLPFLLDTLHDNHLSKLLKFEDRKHFITIGNFLHEPNYNVVLYLKNTVWPLIIKALPTAELHIYGAYTSEKVRQLHNQNQGFLVKGFAVDVNEVMQKAKVCLAPIQFGAGLKGKLIDAMVNGTPAVMSAIAAEGMFGNFKANGFIEDNPELFAKKAIELYSNLDLWKEHQDNGFQVINKRFLKRDFENNFIENIEGLKQNLQQHRHHNFIGEMLQHHTLQSTKYLSKWIETKNKKHL